MFDIQTLFDGTSLVSGGRKHDFTAPPYHIVVVGSSGSGKTTLVNFIRNSELTNQIDIPLRYVTRPQRENDDLGENRPVTHNEFEKLASEGIIAVQWQRDLGGDKKRKIWFCQTYQRPDGSLFCQ